MRSSQEGNPVFRDFRVIPVKAIRTLQTCAQSIVENWIKPLCEGLFHFVDFDGTDVAPLDRVVGITSLIDKLKQLPRDQTAIFPEVVLEHLLSLVNEDEARANKEQCEEGIKAMAETLKGALHLLLEGGCKVMVEGFFCPHGILLHETWESMCGSAEDVPIRGEVLNGLYTLLVWTRVVENFIP